MHELSLAQGMIEQLTEAAQAENAIRINRIEVIIGHYSGVEQDAFEFAFPFAAEGTPAENAELVVRMLPVSVRCNACGKTSNPEPTLLRCTACASNDVELTGGREFYIRSVELEVP